jgi:hypothetical protein
MSSQKTNHAARLVPALAIFAIALTVAGCSSNDSGGGGVEPPPPAANTAPAVSAIADRSADQDTVIGPIEFGITDSESDVNALTVTAATDAPTVFPADAVVFSGTGATRSLTLTPLEAATGPANVTLSVTDPAGATTMRTFVVTVNARAASIQGVTLSTFAKGESEDPTALNGFTFAQDADDSAAFDSLIGTEE